MKLRRKLWLGAGVLALLPVLFLLEEHCRGNWALERWKARMTTQGEKFEIDSLTPLQPEDADNGLPKLIWFASLLTAVPDISNIMPPTTRLAAPGKLVFVPAQSERSEEHTSELQSHSDLVCRLLLEKKKKKPSRSSPRTTTRPTRWTTTSSA